MRWSLAGIVWLIFKKNHLSLMENGGSKDIRNTLDNKNIK